jgi:hypothetical protein
MTSPAPTPTPPADEPQGSLGAVLIGGAILVIAGLLIFWPDGDTATRTGGKPGGSAQQANNAVAGEGGGGAGAAVRGVAPRENDPAQGRVQPRVTPGLIPPNQGMAPPRPPKPEPTSFPSAQAEIEYWEKKLDQARSDLEMRSTFLTRVKKMQAEMHTPEEQQRLDARAEIVQKNYDTAKQKVDELEQKVAGLKAKQAAG